MDKEKLETLANKAAARALKNRKNVEMEILEDDDAYEGDMETVDIEEIVEFDIFDFCQKEFVEKGDYIDYSIKKNGALAGTKKHPYSWEKVQKEFGEGRYQVIAKSKTTGRIVKKQSMEVEGLNGHAYEDEKKSSFDPSDLVSKIAEAVKPKQEGPNFMELFTLMNNASEKARIEAERAAEKQQSTVVQMMQQNTQMMLAMFQSQTQAPKQDNTVELARLIQSFAEKMENRFEKTIDKIQAQNQPKDNVSVIEMIKMREEAQEKGFKLYSQLNQLAETKAQEKVELIEEYRGEGGSSEKKDKSMTETLIETMLPTIAGALAKTASTPAAPQIPQRRVVSGPIGVRPGTPRPKTQTLPKANLEPKKAAVQTGRENPRQSVQVPRPLNQSVNSDSGLPKANFTVSKPQPAAKTVEAVSTQWKKSVTDLLVPVYTGHLLEQTEPVKVAPIILGTLAQNGIGREEFLEKVSSSDILDVVKGFELPEIAYPWFEEIYAHIKAGTYNAIGEHTQNV
jgi:hypothetical protein